MSATGSERGKPDLIDLAQVGVLHFELDDDILRIERVPLHPGKRDFHLHELAVSGDTSTANGERAVREFHNRIKCMDRIRSYDPSHPGKTGQIEIVALVPQCQYDW